MSKVFSVLLMVAVAVLMAVPSGAQSSQANKITIFVSKFQDASGETGRSWWYQAGIQDIGEVFRAYIKNRLLSTGNFRVFDFEKTAEETERINRIAAETNPGAAVGQGQLQVHSYVIEGTVANVAVVSKGSGGIGAVLGVGSSTDIVSVQVMVNMRDQETGETLFSEQVNGEKKRTGVVVATDEGAGATGSSGERAGDVGFALEDAAGQIVGFVLEKFPIQGTVLKLDQGGKACYVDIGSSVGLKVGDMLNLVIYEEVDLGVKTVYRAKIVGDLKVIEIIDDTTCLVAVKKGKATVGDTVQLVFKAKR